MTQRAGAVVAAAAMLAGLLIPGLRAAGDGAPFRPRNGEIVIEAGRHREMQGSLPAGSRVRILLRNGSTVPLAFNPTYEACNLTYRAESGRTFIVPPGTHCDVLHFSEVAPGRTVQIFEWSLDECVEDRWGCVRSEPLPAGSYSIEGKFAPAVHQDGGIFPDMGAKPVAGSVAFRIA